ncbi:hypothetical protein N9937_01665 [bacterium]|nr:hypothetical protein [bacterium]
MMTLFGLLCVIAAAGLIGEFNIWFVPWALAAGIFFYAADKSSVDDVELLGGCMLIFFVAATAYYILSTAWTWGRGVL